MKNSISTLLPILSHHYRQLELRLGDWLSLGLAFLFIIFLYYSFWFNFNQRGVEFVAIQVGNHTPSLYPISENRTIVIPGFLGDSHIEIKNGRVHFKHSACRNKQCIQHGWIEEAGSSIACLPNHISVSLIGRDSQFDALNF